VGVQRKSFCSLESPVTDFWARVCVAYTSIKEGIFLNRLRDTVFQEKLRPNGTNNSHEMIHLRNVT